MNMVSCLAQLPHTEYHNSTQIDQNRHNQLTAMTKKVNQPPKVRSCDFCRNNKIRCDRAPNQCSNCAKRGIDCTRNNPYMKRGPKPKHFKVQANEDKVESAKLKASEDFKFNTNFDFGMDTRYCNTNGNFNETINKNNVNLGPTVNMDYNFIENQLMSPTYSTSFGTPLGTPLSNNFPNHPYYQNIMMQSGIEQVSSTNSANFGQENTQMFSYNNQLLTSPSSLNYPFQSPTIEGEFEQELGTDTNSISPLLSYPNQFSLTWDGGMAMSSSLNQNTAPLVHSTIVPTLTLTNNVISYNSASPVYVRWLGEKESKNVAYFMTKINPHLNLITPEILFAQLSANTHTPEPELVSFVHKIVRVAEWHLATDESIANSYILQFSMSTNFLLYYTGLPLDPARACISAGVHILEDLIKSLSA